MYFKSFYTFCIILYCMLLVENTLKKKNHILELFYIDKTLLFKFIQKKMNIAFDFHLVTGFNNVFLINFILFNSLLNCGCSLLDLFYCKFTKSNFLVYNLMSFLSDKFFCIYAELFGDSTCATSSCTFFKNSI